jgi:glycyl-tRNA synthetase
MKDLMENLISLAKRRGFIFPGSEIYGGLANSWDYGPLGVELKNNIKQEWWRRFVQRRADMVGIDSALIMNPKAWEASGHLKEFSDPLVECKKCHERYRVDNLPINIADLNSVRKEFLLKVDQELSEVEKEHEIVEHLISVSRDFLNDMDVEFNDEDKKALETTYQAIVSKAEKKLNFTSEKLEFIKFIIDSMSLSEKFIGVITQIYLRRLVVCTKCKSMDWSLPRQFNLMFKTFLGPVEDEDNIVYFRPETAQGMFVNFKNVLDTARKRLPFGIAQIGKAFRNEITPGNFIFRTREFEQMEIEYFIKADEWEKHFDHWLTEMRDWLKDLGVKKWHEAEIPDGERAHYSKRTVDIEYDFPFGKKELYGLAYRTDFDLKNHMEKSGEDLRYTDPETNEKFLPHVIEPTWGVDRSVLGAMLEAYEEEEAPTAEEGETEKRVVMKFPKWLAPVKVAILPLSKKEELSGKAKEIYQNLSEDFACEYDETQSIGKRYRRQDEIGTPYCVTIDFKSLEDGSVTVRDRDTMKQDRIKTAELKNYLKNNLESEN